MPKLVQLERSVDGQEFKDNGYGEDELKRGALREDLAPERKADNYLRDDDDRKIPQGPRPVRVSHARVEVGV